MLIACATPTASTCRLTHLMNCLLYARVSTDKQAQKELSIPAQIEAMREFARRNNWKVVGRFVDAGESARTANRPQLKRLIQYCKDNKDVDVVIVHKIDRLARNLIDHATIKAVLKQKGIRLVSVSEPFDDNPVGQLLENILASISEWYSANLGEEIKKAYSAKVKRGEWPHSPPIGYRSIKDEQGRAKHIPDDTLAPLVRQAFELYSTGHYSLRALSLELAQRGLRTRSGRGYSDENIKKLLQRRFYAGRFEWQGKEYQGTHAPIVPKALFHQVQDVLQRRSADTGEKGKLEFLLRGVAYCGDCGQRLTGEIHPRGSYYRCVPSSRDKATCDQPYTPVKHLDGQLEALYERLQPPPEFLEMLKIEMQQIAERRSKIAKEELVALQRTIAETEQKEVKLLDEMLAGKVREDLYQRMAKRYLAKRREAEARLAQLEVDYDDPLDFLDKCIVVGGMLSHLHRRFGFEQRKDLLRAVFERIEVKDRSIVDVKLNPPFSLFFDEKTRGLFKGPPGEGTKQDIFEQVVRFTLSEHYRPAKTLIEGLAGWASPPAHTRRQRSPSLPLSDNLGHHLCHDGKAENLVLAVRRRTEEPGIDDRHT